MGSLNQQIGSGQALEALLANLQRRISDLERRTPGAFGGGSVAAPFKIGNAILEGEAAGNVDLANLIALSDMKTNGAIYGFAVGQSLPTVTGTVLTMDSITRVPGTLREAWIAPTVGCTVPVAGIYVARFHAAAAAGVAAQSEIQSKWGTIAYSSVGGNFGAMDVLWLDANDYVNPLVYNSGSTTTIAGGSFGIFPLALFP